MLKPHCIPLLRKLSIGKFVTLVLIGSLCHVKGHVVQIGVV